MTVEKTVHPVPLDSIKKDDVVLFLEYAKVDRIVRHPTMPTLYVHDLDRDMPFEVKGQELIITALSASYFKEEVEVTATDLARILISSYNTPFTVEFEKADGEIRVLTGRLIAEEPLLGRSRVEDLTKPKGDRMRLVDHRTIRYLIVNGVKYVVKGGGKTGKKAK